MMVFITLMDDDGRKCLVEVSKIETIVYDGTRTVITTANTSVRVREPVRHIFDKLNEVAKMMEGF